MKKGFTLIELLVVVLIIGILAAIALPQYTKAVEKSRMSEALMMISGAEKSMQRYIFENGFPQGGAHSKALADAMDIDFSGGKWEDDGNIGYFTKNFLYGVGCSSFYCWITAIRITGNHENGYDEHYYLNLFLYPSNEDAKAAWGDDYDGISGNIVKDCEASYGKYKGLCAGLKGNGWHDIAN